MPDTNVNPFLDEINNLVRTVKGMIENQFRMMAPFKGQGFPQASFVPVGN